MELLANNNVVARKDHVCNFCSGKIKNGADSCDSFPVYEDEIKPLLLDVFRDTADFWGERKIAFRCFYSFL